MAWMLDVSIHGAKDMVSSVQLACLVAPGKSVWCWHFTHQHMSLWFCWVWGFFVGFLVFVFLLFDNVRTLGEVFLFLPSYSFSGLPSPCQMQKEWYKHFPVCTFGMFHWRTGIPRNGAKFYSNFKADSVELKTFLHTQMECICLKYF